MLLEKRVNIATDYRKYGKAIADSNIKVRSWQSSTIYQVLKNQVYIGTLIQGKNQKHLFESKKRERLSKEYWTITEDAHEAIIAKEVFNEVQRLILSKVKTTRKINEKKENSTFKGKVYCSICGRKMSSHRYLSGKTKTFYFICNRFGMYSVEKCMTSITESVLERIVKACFKNIFLQNKKSYKAYLSSYESLQKELEKEKKKKLVELERKFALVSRIQSEYYEKYVLGSLSREDFEKEKIKILQNKKELLKEVEQVNLLFSQKSKKLSDKHKYLEAIFDSKSKSWDKEFIDTIIDKILIGADNEIEIKFNFEEKPIITSKLLKDRLKENTL